MPGRFPVLTMPQLKKLREWHATPRRERKTLRVLSDLLGISYSTAKRGASGRDYYARVP